MMEVQTAVCQDSFRPARRLFLAGLLALALLGMMATPHAHATNLSAACPSGVATPCLASLTPPASITMNSSNQATLDLQLTIIGAVGGTVYGTNGTTNPDGTINFDWPHRFQVDWGDGSGPTNLVHTVNNQSTCGTAGVPCDPFVVQHIYTQAGTKNINVIFPGQQNGGAVLVKAPPGATRVFSVTWGAATAELCDSAKPYTVSWAITDSASQGPWQVTVTWARDSSGQAIAQDVVPASPASSSLSHVYCGANPPALLGSVTPSVDVLFAEVGHKSKNSPGLTLVDTTAPALPTSVTAPATSTNGALVTIAATDNVWGSRTASCSPAQIGIGAPTVVDNCTATDGSGNAVTGSVSVTVTDAPTLNVPPDATIPATEALGARYAAYSALPTATNWGGGSLSVACGAKAPGDLFPIGKTTVTCTATGANNQSTTRSFTVTVTDTPTLTIPRDTALRAASEAGAPLTFEATLTDHSGTSPASCDYASGTTFPIGQTTVNCTAPQGSPTGHFTVTVVDPVGSVVAPGPATVEATSSAGAVYTYNLPTAIGAFKHATVTATVACTPASGSTFAIATTLVSCTATDEFQTTATATFTVTVRDTTAPVVTPPADITIGATGTTGAAVTFPAGSATDIVDGAVPVTCTGYASGDTFPIGTTTVTCSATDSAGNTGTGSFKVTVTPPPPSGPADADACKHDGWKDYPDLHFKNQGDCVSYVATHGKNPPAGDNHDNSSNSDHKPPKLDVPDNITVHTTDEHGTKVTYTVSATDDSGRRPEVHCTAPSGSLFEVGKTTVKCSAADASGNTVVGTFNVTVVLDHPKKDDAKDGDGEHGDHQDDHH